MASPRLHLAFVVGLASTACGHNTSDDGSNDGETGSGSTASSDTGVADDGVPCVSPTLRLINHSTNAIQVIHFLACDMSDGNDYPIPPPGLADGETGSYPFPGPGCWILAYEGEGCFNDNPVNTGELACDDVYVWTPDDSDHVCSG